MSKRGAYLGGHTLIRALKPWWNPDDIPLEQTGHLNARSQIASDQAIVRYFIGWTYSLSFVRTQDKRFDRDQVREVAERLYCERGSDVAIAESVRLLREEVKLQPPETRKKFEKVFEAIQNISVHQTKKGGKKSRLGKREREQKRDLLRGARDRTLPEESYGRLQNILDRAKRK